MQETAPETPVIDPPAPADQPQPTAAEPDWLPERLDRARRTAISALLEELGFADLEALKTALGEQAQTIETLTQAQQQAAHQIEQVEAARQQVLMEAAFQQATAPYDFIDVGEVRALADFSGVQVDEAGQVIGMTAAIEALVEARPHLLKRHPIPNIDAGAGYSAADGDPLTPQFVESVKKKFRLR